MQSITALTSFHLIKRFLWRKRLFGHWKAKYMLLSVNDVIWRYCGYRWTLFQDVQSWTEVLFNALLFSRGVQYHILASTLPFFHPFLTCMSGCRYNSDDCCVASSLRLASSLGSCDAQCWKIRVEHIGGDELVCAWWVLHRRRGSAWCCVSISCLDTGVQWWLRQIFRLFSPLPFWIFIVVSHRVVQWVLQGSVAHHLWQHFPLVSYF